MPNDGNKIYSQTVNGKRYGVSLDQDVCTVLGLPQNTDLRTAATSSKVNSDSLIKPVGVSVPPNLTTAGKTDAVVKNELLEHLGNLNYGYSIPTITLTPSLSQADLNTIKGKTWSRIGIGTNNYVVLDHFDGYNHTVKYTGQWGPTNIQPYLNHVGFGISPTIGSAADGLISPMGMKYSDVDLDTKYPGVAVYWKNTYSNPATYTCVAVIGMGGASANGNISSGEYLSSPPLKEGDTYVIIPFISSNQVNTTSSTTVNGPVNWNATGLGAVSGVVYCVTFRSSYPSVVEAVATNNTLQYDISAGAVDANYSQIRVTGSCKLNGVAQSEWKIYYSAWLCTTRDWNTPPFPYKNCISRSVICEKKELNQSNPSELIQYRPNVYLPPAKQGGTATTNGWVQIEAWSESATNGKFIRRINLQRNPSMPQPSPGS